MVVNNNMKEQEMNTKKNTSSVILNAENLSTYFHTDQGIAKVLEGVNFSLRQGETLGIIGESGCGKSTTALSIMGLLQSPPAFIPEGHIWFKKIDLLTLSNEEKRHFRGRHIGMIFQEPMTSLNPVLTIEDQLTEPLLIHKGLGKKEAIEQVSFLLESVYIKNPKRILKEYPFALSGGMRQRVMIAMAISCAPEVLIADEPTTALDVIVQAQIIDILKELQGQENGVIIITHDLGVIAEMTDYVVVMYAGCVVEKAPVLDLFNNPLHPYTQGLLGAIPRPGMRKGTNTLIEIPGEVPNLLNFPKSCRFCNRCNKAKDICFSHLPLLKEVADKHFVACFLFE